MKILLIIKPTFWCNIVKRFLEENFSELSVLVGDWGDEIPDSSYNWEGDYIISFLSPWILPKRILNNAKKGSINFHPAPPNYPGIGGYNFAIYENAKEYGVTCHHMIEEVDSGQIIAVKKFPVYGNESVLALKEKSMIYLVELFYEILDYILRNKKLPTSNERWLREPYTRSNFQELCKLDLNMTKEEFAKRVKATYFQEALDYPNIKIGNKIYYLVDPEELKKQK